jgi:hypothetical protein
MWTIVDAVSGLVLFAKFDSEHLEGQVAVTEMCTLPNPDLKNVYWNFETKEFYFKD